jgi:hypothetical protein
MLPLIFGGLIGAAATAFIVKMGEGMIDVNGDHIHTNLAKRGELKELADRLTAGCNDNDALEIQKLFDYVTAIPYRSDHTSRHPSDVISSNWGDCDDKSNLFASLLQERGHEYRFVYVPEHVFVVVHIKNKQASKASKAKLIIDGKPFYYAETTLTGARIGTYNDCPLKSIDGVYDVRRKVSVAMENISFKKSVA